MNAIPDFFSEYPALFGAIRKIVPPSMKIYLVGGAVRDVLLGRKISDFDFSVEGLVRPIGKHIAHELNGAYYVLDDEREMVRVIVQDETTGGQFGIDIALMSGNDIEDDLRERDFTFNAMAIELGGTPRLVDPLGGQQDLEQGILRMCAPDSLRNDPMRALRALRMSLEFGLTMDDELIRAMEAVPEYMGESSFERYRDELFKIVRLNKNAEAMRICERFGFLDHLFPNHTAHEGKIDVEWIENVDLLSRMIISRSVEEDPSGDAFLNYASARLGNYKTALVGFFEKTLALYHSRKMILSFSAVVRTLSQDTDLIKKWCGRLAFSSTETAFALLSIQGFDHLNSLPENTSYSDVDIYRFFRQFKEGGISALMLFLADKLSDRGKPGAYKTWCDHVVFVQDFIAAFFSRYMEVIAPKPILSGDDIQAVLQMPAGPEIGYAKNSLIEAQIRGSVKTVGEAEAFLRLLMKTN